MGSGGKEGYRYNLDDGKVEECITINVNHHSLYRSRLSKLLGRGRESVNITTDRKRWGESNSKAQEKRWQDKLNKQTKKSKS